MDADHEGNVTEFEAPTDEAAVGLFTAIVEAERIYRACMIAAKTLEFDLNPDYSPNLFLGGILS